VAHIELVSVFVHSSCSVAEKIQWALLVLQKKPGVLPLIETLGFSNYILQKMSARREQTALQSIWPLEKWNVLHRRYTEQSVCFFLSWNSLWISNFTCDVSGRCVWDEAENMFFVSYNVMFPQMAVVKSCLIHHGGWGGWQLHLSSLSHYASLSHDVWHHKIITHNVIYLWCVTSGL